LERRKGGFDDFGLLSDGNKVLAFVVDHFSGAEKLSSLFEAMLGQFFKLWRYGGSGGLRSITQQASPPLRRRDSTSAHPPLRRFRSPSPKPITPSSINCSVVSVLLTLDSDAQVPSFRTQGRRNENPLRLHTHDAEFATPQFLEHVHATIC
jgi:hypothetical protein